MRTQRSRSILILSTLLALTAGLGPARTGLAQALDPRWGFTGDFGSGVGYTSSFWTFDAFVPLWATQEDNLFADWRPIVGFNGLLANNFGTGYRIYSPGSDRMFGFNGYWDWRDAGNGGYNQVGGGFETVGRNWAFRSNFYIPINPGERLLAVGPLSAPRFQEFNIVTSQNRLFQTALPGLDAEVGVPLPVNFGLWAFAGVYGYNQPDRDIAVGGRVRVETRLSDNITANVTAQDDRIFGFTANVQLAWYWRGFKPRLGFSGQSVTEGTGYQRLAMPVQRNYNVVVNNFTRTVVNPLHDSVPNALTGEFPVIRVIHVDNASTGQNLGTFENPATSLAVASGTSRPGDIIFVHNTDPTNTVGMRSGIQLQNGQRLLAGGFNHIVSTQELGNILLPQNFAGAAFAGQTITNTVALSSIIVLRNDNEVSGFTIRNSRMHGIANGSQISGVPVLDPAGNPSNLLGININRNTIIDTAAVNNNQGAGIFLTNAFGTVNIGVPDVRNGTNGIAIAGGWGNTITGHPLGGILVHKDTAVPNLAAVPTDTTLRIANNVITANGNNGLSQIDVPVGSINGPGANPVTVTLQGPDAASGNLSGDTLNGIAVVVEGGNAFQRATITPIITNNIVANNGGVAGGVPHGDGIHLRASLFGGLVANTAGVTPLISGNTVTGNAYDGIWVGAVAQTDGQGTGNDNPLIDSLTIRNNIASGNGQPSLNGISATGNGIDIQASGTGQITNLLIGGVGNGNTIQRNAANGILVQSFTDGNQAAGVGPTINANIFDNIIGNTVAQQAGGALNGNGSPSVGGLDPVGTGVRIVGNGAGVINANLQRNQIIGNVLNGVSLRGLGTGNNNNNAAATMNISILDSNIITFNGVRGNVFQTAVPNGNNNQTTNESAGNGIAALIDDPTVFTLRVADSVNNLTTLPVTNGNTIDNNFNNGMSIITTSSGLALVTIRRNLSIQNNGANTIAGDIDTHNGIYAVFAPQTQQNAQSLNNQLSIVGNQNISNNGGVLVNDDAGANTNLIGDGVHVEVPGGLLTLQIGDNTLAGANTINRNAGDGVHIRGGATVPNLNNNNNATNAMIMAQIAGNTINSNGFNRITGAVSANAVQFNNGANANGNGLYIEAAGTSQFLAEGTAPNNLLPLAGVDLADFQNAVFNANQVIQNNIIDGNAANGIFARSTGTAATNVLLLSLANNQVNWNGGGTIGGAGNGTQTPSARATTLAGFMANGIRIDTGAGTSFNGIINNHSGAANFLGALPSITNNGDHGILVNMASVGLSGLNNPITDLTITNNTANNNNLTGILVSNTGSNNNVLIANNTTTVNSNGADGIAVLSGFGGGGGTSTFTIDNNVVRGNGRQVVVVPGLPPVVPAAFPSLLNTLDGGATGNNVNGGTNVGNGIVFNAYASAATNRAIITNNTVTGNVNDGIVVNNDINATAGGLALNITGNIVGGTTAPTGGNTPPTTTANVGNGGDGIEVNLRGAASGTLLAPIVISNNNVRNNGYNGIFLNALSANNVVNVNGNITNNNGFLTTVAAPANTTDGNGVFVSLTGAGNTITVDGTGGQSNANFRDGVRVTTQTGTGANTVSVINYAQIRQNGLLPLPGQAGHGIHLIDNGGPTLFTISGNTIGGSVANRNFGDGILVEGNVLHNPLSSITGNSSTFNGANGIEYTSGANANAITIGSATGVGNNNVSSNTLNGILVTLAPALNNNTVNILNNTNINSNGVDGIQVNMQNASATTVNVQGNTLGTGVAATGNTRHGINVFTSGSANTNTVNIGTTTGNTSNNSGGDGILVTLAGTNQVANIGSATTGIGNTTSANNRLGTGFGGIDLVASSGAANTFNVFANTSSGNLNPLANANAAGIRAASLTTANTTTFNIGNAQAGNTVTNNLNSFGINVIAGGTTVANVINNTVSGNGLGGINYTTNIGQAGTALTIDSNTVSANANNGIHVASTFAGVNAATHVITNNQSSGNTTANGNGIRLDIASNSGTYNVNSNNGNGIGVSGNAADGINFQVTGNNNTLAANGNLGVNSNTGNGISFTFANAASGNVYSASNNAIGAAAAGNGGDGLLIAVTGTGANNNGLTVNDNQISNNAGNGISYTIGATAGSGNNISMLRNVVQANGVNGLLITNNSAAVATQVVANNNSFLANTANGIRLLETAGQLNAQIVGNTFGGANGVNAFNAQTTGGRLQLSFLRNTAAAGGATDYVYTQTAGQFRFENPFFGNMHGGQTYLNDVGLFTFYSALGDGTHPATNQPGTFTFTGFVGHGTEDVDVGGFFPDPGPPY